MKREIFECRLSNVDLRMNSSPLFSSHVIIRRLKIEICHSKLLADSLLCASGPGGCARQFRGVPRRLKTDGYRDLVIRKSKIVIRNSFPMACSMLRGRVDAPGSSGVSPRRLKTNGYRDFVIRLSFAMECSALRGRVDTPGSSGVSPRRLKTDGYRDFDIRHSTIERHSQIEIRHSTIRIHPLLLTVPRILGPRAPVTLGTLLGMPWSVAQARMAKQIASFASAGTP